MGRNSESFVEQFCMATAVCFWACSWASSHSTMDSASCTSEASVHTLGRTAMERATIGTSEASVHTLGRTAAKASTMASPGFQLDFGACHNPAHPKPNTMVE